MFFLFCTELLVESGHHHDHGDDLQDDFHDDNDFDNDYDVDDVHRATNVKSGKESENTTI